MAYFRCGGGSKTVTLPYDIITGTKVYVSGSSGVEDVTYDADRIREYGCSKVKVTVVSGSLPTVRMKVGSTQTQMTANTLYDIPTTGTFILEIAATGSSNNITVFNFE